MQFNFDRTHEASILTSENASLDIEGVIMVGESSENGELITLLPGMVAQESNPSKIFEFDEVVVEEISEEFFEVSAQTVLDGAISTPGPSFGTVFLICILGWAIGSIWHWYHVYIHSENM